MPDYEAMFQALEKILDYEEALERGELAKVEHGSEEWQERLRMFLADPRREWWWLSFADDNRPAGQKFLGVCIVPGGNVVQAAHLAHLLGCNPGGEVAAFPLGRPPKPEWIGRLLDKEQATLLDAAGPDALFVADES